jgi:hypothetical protein
MSQETHQEVTHQVWFDLEEMWGNKHVRYGFEKIDLASFVGQVSWV